DLITFTSSSTVENFLDLKLPWPAGMKVASIGPITSATARERGLSVDVEAKQHDIAGLVEAIRKFYGARFMPDDFASTMQELSAADTLARDETRTNDFASL